jgi:integrase
MMASISKDSTGKRRLMFVGADGKRHTIYLGPMPAKACEAVRAKVEAILASQSAKISIDRETADWLGSLDAKLHAKLVAAGLAMPRAGEGAQPATLAAFIDQYVATRTDVKPGTRELLGYAKARLVEFFGEGKRLADITAGDADEFRRWLFTVTGENTARRLCGRAKQFFRAAVRKRLVAESAFADMKGVSVLESRGREFFVTRAMAQRVLDACPDAQWRLLFALSRFGGLRCPSEHLALRWGDVDWERGRIRVPSPKTEHHEGRAFRWLPMFPELRPHLEAVWELAEPGTEHVITRYRDPNGNLRTQLERIIRKAGLEPWAKPWQNLRSTRETELAETYPIHVVCAWIGNTEAVARKHYLQVTDEHFNSATQNPTQQAAERGGKGKKPKPTPIVFSEDFTALPSNANVKAAQQGFEP